MPEKPCPKRGSGVSSLPEEPQDLIGIGFGPANLALAIALRDHNARGSTQVGLSASFVERQTPSQLLRPALPTEMFS